MDEYLLVYLLDVKRAIEELESYFKDYPSMRFDIFVEDYKTRSAVERKVEIMGEAINRILKIRPDFSHSECEEYNSHPKPYHSRLQSGSSRVSLELGNPSHP